MTYNRTEAVEMRHARASAAPQRKPEVQKKVIKPIVLKPKSKKELRHAERLNNRKAMKVLAVCSILFFFIALQIYSQVQVDELDRKLDSINTEIAVVESENTRLSMELDATLSLDKVDDYAQNVLGMVKVENYQISYIDLSNGDTVVESGGKVKQSLWETLKVIF